MKKPQAATVIAREFRPFRQAGSRNPFQVLRRLQSEAWARQSDFAGTVSTSRRIVRAVSPSR